MILFKIRFVFLGYNFLNSKQIQFDESNSKGKLEVWKALFIILIEDIKHFLCSNNINVIDHLLNLNNILVKNNYFPSSAVLIFRRYFLDYVCINNY